MPETLTPYKTLYGKVAWAQSVIKAQLDIIATDIAETHQLYSDVEARHEVTFRGWLEGSPSEQSGGEDGSARQR